MNIRCSYVEIENYHHPPSALSFISRRAYTRQSIQELRQMEGFAKVLLPKRNPSAVRMNKIQNFTLDSTRKREKQLFITKSLGRNNNPSSIDFTFMHVEL